MDLKYWWNLADGYDWNHENKETYTEWYHRIDDDTMYLSFCGSDGTYYKNKKLTTDWRQNFSIKRVPYKDMSVKFKVHKGFLEKWKSIRDEVLNLTDGIKKVEISGFSQGSAIALLAHEDIVFNIKIEPTTVIFGCPRVVSWRAPKDRWKTLTRVQLSWDMVPGLPWFIGGYKHVGEFIHKGRWPSFFRFWPWDHLKYWDRWD